MEQQIKLWKYDKNLTKSVTKLEPNLKSLEEEKTKFIQNLCEFLDRLNFETVQFMGRPKADFRDIIKSLMMMSYHGFSYRRTASDLKKMHEEKHLTFIPSRSVLNLYANDENTVHLISKLIQASSLFFTEEENTLILDSTWLALRMYTGGYRKVHDKKSADRKSVV